MNLNHYNIHINPVGLTGAAASRYRAQVAEHLLWIYRTTSGRILLNSIRRPTYPIEIRPHPIHECNAVGGGEVKPAAVNWTGFVTYSPFEFSQHGACSALPAGQDRGRLWDEILFHELIHVFRNATGKWNPTPQLTFAMRQYDDNEEFIAVLCTNIYVADRSNRIKSGLRAGHQGFGAMSAADAMRFGLFSSSRAAYGLVKQFCADNPIFTKALSDKLADVTYNPIADYYRFPKICEAFSHFGAFKDRAELIRSLTAVGIPAAVAGQLAALLP